MKTRNQILNFGTFFIAFPVFLFFYLTQSCTEEDTTPPEISILSPVLNDTLRNEVSIQIEAKDNEGISYVEIYANDSLIGKINGSVNNFKWNTIHSKDGEYILKCKAYDRNSNFKEITRNIVIENALLKVEIDELYGAVYNLLITDSIGNIIAKTTFQSNDKFSIKPDTFFNKETINFFYFISNGTYTSINSYLNVKRGFTLKTGMKVSNSNPGNITVHIKNSNISFSEVMLSTNKGVRSLYSFADTISPIVLNYTTNHPLLVQLKTNSGKFYKLFDLNNKSDIHIDLNEITALLTEKTINYPEGMSGSCLLTGYSNQDESDRLNEYYIHNGVNTNVNRVNVYYPPEFKRFNTYISCQNMFDKSVYYTGVVMGNIPDVYTPLTLNAEVVCSQLNNFNLTLHGDADFYLLSYVHGNVFLNIKATTNLTRFKFPDLKTTFNRSDIDISALELKKVEFCKVADLPKERYLNKYIYSESNKIPWQKYDLFTKTF